MQDVLKLEQLDDNAFVSRPVLEGRDRLYGGQVAAQALLAAGATVGPGRSPHSMHGYFLRRGDPDTDYTLHVMRDLDGNRFSNRRVEAHQHGETLFTLTASFQVPTTGVERQLSAAPDVEGPESLPAEQTALLVDIDYRVPEHDEADVRLPERPEIPHLLATKFWVRSKVALPDDPVMHAAVLTYISDWSSGLVAGHVGPWIVTVSLDHAMWFHRQIRLDEWTLFDLAPRNAAGGRGWYSGHVYDRDGVLGTSFTQEALYGQDG